MTNAYSICSECSYVQDFSSEGAAKFENYLASQDAVPEICDAVGFPIAPAQFRSWCQTTATTCEDYCAFGMELMMRFDVDKDQLFSEEEYINSFSSLGFSVSC